MSARVSRLSASFALATALSAPLLLHAGTASAVTCAPNSDVSSSGCGNTGPGNSGFNNTGTANSGLDNHGTANSGLDNNGPANSGIGNTGVGNSGCNNTGVVNSGFGNTGVALSGGASECVRTPSKPPTVVPGKPPSLVAIPGEAPAGEAPAGNLTASTGTLPLTGSSSGAPLALAIGLLASGGAAVMVANRRRMASVGLNGATTESPVPLSVALGMLLTGASAGRRNKSAS